LQEKVDLFGYDTISNPFEKEAICSKVAINTIKQHFYFYLRIHIQGILSMFASVEHRSIAAYFGITPNHTISSDHPLSISPKRFFSDNLVTIFIGLYIIFSLCFNYFFFIAGSIFMLKNKISRTWVLLLGLIIYFSGLAGVLGLRSGERFKLPITPFICIVAGYGCYCLLKQLKVLFHMRLEDSIKLIYRRRKLVPKD
jgi:hypothetical protein